MKFEMDGNERAQLNASVHRLGGAQGENYNIRLRHSVQQMGEFILRFCDPTDKEREAIQFTFEQIERDQKRKL